MQQISLLLLAAFLLMACNSDTNKETAGEPSADSITASPDSTASLSNCYAYTNNGDTIQLQLTAAGNTFTGHMLYQLKEKDRNDGSLTGTISGDTLIADYTFSSEGMQSVRQVAFLKQNNSLKEGFGELKTEGNKWIFANRQSIHFTGFQLTPASCN